MMTFRNFLVLLFAISPAFLYAQHLVGAWKLVSENGKPVAHELVAAWRVPTGTIKERVLPAIR
jgi:hypothetical protein